MATLAQLSKEGGPSYASSVASSTSFTKEGSTFIDQHGNEVQVPINVDPYDLNRETIKAGEKDALLNLRNSQGYEANIRKKGDVEWSHLTLNFTGAERQFLIDNPAVKDQIRNEIIKELSRIDSPEAKNWAMKKDRDNGLVDSNNQPESADTQAVGRGDPRHMVIATNYHETYRSQENFHLQFLFHRFGVDHDAKVIGRTYDTTRASSMDAIQGRISHILHDASPEIFPLGSIFSKDSTMRSAERAQASNQTTQQLNQAKQDSASKSVAERLSRAKSEIETRINNINIEMNERQAELDGLTNTAVDIEAAFELSKEVNQLENKVSQLEEENAQINEALAERTKERDVLTEKLEEAEGERGKAQELLANKSMELSAKKDEIEGKDTEIKELNGLNKELTKEHDKAIEARDALQEKVNGLEKERTELYQEIENDDKRISSLEGEVKSLREGNQRMENLTQSYEKINDKLQGQNAELGEQISSLKEEGQGLKKSFSELEGKLQKRDEAYQQKITDLEGKLEQRDKDHQKEIERLKAELAAAQATAEKPADKPQAESDKPAESRDDEPRDGEPVGGSSGKDTGDTTYKATLAGAFGQPERDGDVDIYKSSNGKPLIRDSKEGISSYSHESQVVKTLVEASKQRYGLDINVQGSKKFTREVWLEANLQGMNVKGYEPSQKDKKHLQEQLRKNAPDGNIRPGREDENDDER